MIEHAGSTPATSIWCYMQKKENFEPLEKENLEPLADALGAIAIPMLFLFSVSLILGPLLWWLGG